MQGHLLKYKNEKGEWVTLPVSIVDVYTTYKTYCKQEGIDAVSEKEYYCVLGNLSAITANFQELIDILEAKPENIQRFLGYIASGSGTLPTQYGGTGRAFASTDALLDDLREKLSKAGFTDEQRNAITNISSSIIEDALKNKLDTLAITCGTSAPNAATQGSYYFQYEE